MEYLEYLPDPFRETREYREMGNALSPEMKTVSEKIAQVPEEYLPASAGELLPRWEKILNLTPTGDLSQRRFAVLTRLSGLRPYTIVRLRQQLTAAMGEGRFTAEVYPEDFLLRVEVEAGAEELLSAMSRELRRMIPANIELETAAAERQQTGLFAGALIRVSERVRIAVPGSSV